MKQIIVAVAVVAVGVVAVPPAESASKKECLGKKPNVIGTKGNDVIGINTDEDGSGASVNGKWLDAIYDQIVVFADKGNDRITVRSTGLVGVLVCAGDGKDTIEGTDLARIHAGDGYDTVRQTIQCNASPQVLAAEDVRSSYEPEINGAVCWWMNEDSGGWEPPWLR